ncbi:MAG: monovalent cation/H+ antiporter subunit D family protein [Bacillota bacterium]|nr:monovalent cation/H+ antiporter subunit D family protein [Bacillota bacterium]
MDYTEYILYLPLFMIVFPILGALITGLAKENNDRLRNPLAVIVSLISAVAMVIILFHYYYNGSWELLLHQITPGLEIKLRVDPLAALFGGTAGILWFFSVVYSTGYMAHEHNRRRYFIFYLLSLGMTMGIALSANLLTLYIFYEFLTIFTYPLVVHEGNDEAKKAGIKYIIYSFVGAGLILIGLIITYGNMGTLEFVRGGIVNVSSGSLLLWRLTFVSFILGFGVKAAVMPLHAWLPAAMAAPTPVSALLHAVAVVKSGVFGILRVMYSIFGITALIGLQMGYFVAGLVSVTILVASIIAMQQDVLKRRLAFSTISQLGYITLGAGLFSSIGLAGGLLHIINHALLKITLFFCAGAIITVTGKKKISELNGLGKQMPLTMIAFAIASIGMIGIPPVNGFISKWYLIQGSLESGAWIFIVVLIGSALLNAAYFLPIVINAFFKEGDFKAVKGPEAPLTMLIPILVLVAGCLIVGTNLQLTVPFFNDIANYLFYAGGN